jgi:hypothetical protein
LVRYVRKPLLSFLSFFVTKTKFNNQNKYGRIILDVIRRESVRELTLSGIENADGFDSF